MRHGRKAESHGNRTFFSFPFSVSEGRAAVTEGNDLRGLGTCHQQAFTQVFRLRKICVNEPSVQEGITCRYYPEILLPQRSYTRPRRTGCCIKFLLCFYHAVIEPRFQRQASGTVPDIGMTVRSNSGCRIDKSRPRG